MVIVVVSAFQLAFLSYKNRTIANCQTRYNRVLAQAQSERAQIAVQDRESLVKLVRTVSTAKTPERASRALNEYLATQDRLDAERAQHPIPKLPSGACKLWHSME